jgi:hypothetical protein
MADYPGAIPSFVVINANAFQNAPSHSAVHNQEAGEIVAICATLGTHAEGAYATVNARISALEGSIGVNDWTRVATTLQPFNPGDDVDLGTGDLTATDVRVNGVLTNGTQNVSVLQIFNAIADSHVAATAGTGISVVGQQINNTDTGTDAVAAHNLAYDHASFMNNALPDGYVFVGNGVGVAAGVQMTGDVTINNTGVTVVADDSHAHTASTLTLALDDLSDVVAPSPTLDDYLRWNGTNWVPETGGSVSAGSSSTFYLDNDVQAGDYQTLLASPDTVTPEEQDSVTVNNSEGLILGYLYDTALGNTNIASGIWEFDFFAYVSSASGVSTLLYDIFKVVEDAGTVDITGSGTSRTATVTGTTPFVAGDANADAHLASYVQTALGTFQITGFTSSSEVTVATDNAYVNETGVAFTIHRVLFNDESDEIDALTTPAETLKQSAQAQFSINTTDKLALRVYGKTTNVGDITITISHNSTNHYSHFHSPLAITHNQLSGLQGGTSGEYNHLTNAQVSGLHSAVTAGTGIGVAGQVVSLNHLGLQNLVDPNIDRLMGWDDTDGFTNWVVIGSGLTYTHATHTLSAAGGSTLTRGTFSNANLTAGVLTITHSAGLAAPYTIMVVIFDQNGKQILPDEVTGSANSVAVDLTSYGTIVGTWGYGYIA